MKILNFVLGLFLPPLGVFLTYGISTTFFINVALTLLGIIPGSIHGIWAVAKHYEKQGSGAY